jgi:FolB domain-containing protein
MTEKKLHSTLELKDFTLPVHLGCEDWERKSGQSVNFRITFGFKKPPKAEQSDELEDSICYAKVCKKIEALTRETHFKLIEKLAEDVRQNLIENFPNHDYLRVSIHKLKPPVDLLTNGVVYSCGDLSL